MLGNALTYLDAPAQLVQQLQETREQQAHSLQSRFGYNATDQTRRRYRTTVNRQMVVSAAHSPQREAKEQQSNTKQTEIGVTQDTSQQPVSSEDAQVQAVRQRLLERDREARDEHLDVYQRGQIFLQKVNEYNEMMDFAHIAKQTQQAELNGKSQKLILAEVEDDLEKVHVMQVFADKMQNLLQFRAALDEKERRECERDIRLYHDKLSRVVERVRRGAEFILYSESILDSDLKNYIDTKLEEQEYNCIELFKGTAVYALAFSGNINEPLYLTVLLRLRQQENSMTAARGTHSSTANRDCLEEPRIQEWINRVERLAKLLAQPHLLRDTQLAGLYATIIKCQTIIRMRLAIHARTLAHFLHTHFGLENDLRKKFQSNSSNPSNSPILKNSNNNKKLVAQAPPRELELKQLKYSVMETIKQAKDLVQTAMQQQQIRNLLQLQKVRTNTVKRYAGDGGKITSFHLTLNHNNLKPLLKQMAPDYFREPVRNLFTQQLAKKYHRKSLAQTQPIQQKPREKIQRAKVQKTTKQILQKFVSRLHTKAQRAREAVAARKGTLRRSRISDRASSEDYTIYQSIQIEDHFFELNHFKQKVNDTFARQTIQNSFDIGGYNTSLLLKDERTLSKVENLRFFHDITLNRAKEAKMAANDEYVIKMQDLSLVATARCDPQVLQAEKRRSSCQIEPAKQQQDTKTTRSYLPTRISSIPTEADQAMPAYEVAPTVTKISAKILAERRRQSLISRQLAFRKPKYYRLPGSRMVFRGDSPPSHATTGIAQQTLVKTEKNRLNLTTTDQSMLSGSMSGNVKRSQLQDATRRNHTSQDIELNELHDRPHATDLSTQNMQDEYKDLKTQTIMRNWRFTTNR